MLSSEMRSSFCGGRKAVASLCVYYTCQYHCRKIFYELLTRARLLRGEMVEGVHANSLSRPADSSELEML